MDAKEAKKTPKLFHYVLCKQMCLLRCAPVNLAKILLKDTPPSHLSAMGETHRLKPPYNPETLCDHVECDRYDDSCHTCCTAWHMA
jgi:hypothetical protein